MSLSPTGPGKSAPKINADFLAFDPIKSTKPNILLDHPQQLGDTPILPRSDSCKHDYTLKSNQSVTPPLDARPDNSTRYKVAVVCRKCRLHADLKLDYRQSTNPCPNSECPLHHFQRLPTFDEQQQSHLKYAWQCSSHTCRAFLTITFKVQRLAMDDITLLTSTAQLQKRYEDVLRQDPTREGVKQATPVDSVSRLRKYIKDALNVEHTKRVFPAHNKRFMETFGWYGQDCRGFLEAHGFTFSESEGTWTLPNPPAVPDRIDADGESERELLEDVEAELLALSAKVSEDANLPNPSVAEGWPSANQDIERTLASQGYPRYVSIRRGTATGDHNVYFASLGALPDFADKLVDFCYDRQAICDVENQPYYFECLGEIATARDSEDLLMKTTMLTSQGSVSRRDLNEAYSYFGLPRGGGGADDDRIINLYQAQQSDLGPEASERAREMLFRIGNARGSKLLINASQQSIETVEEALAWLGSGVDKSTTDDMLITVFALRTDNDPAKEEIGRKAITVIAQARHSVQLHTWLDTGRTDGASMSVDEALRHLDIEQPFDIIDASLWPQIFESARTDRPGFRTDQAISTLQQALAGSMPAHSPTNWPVGLTSLGNTCYLNSLLQYYFSIKPLRNIVLDYDNFKFDTSDATQKTERVGQRQISLLEIKGGQKFAEDLRHLFEQMIESPESAVKPEQDLVCRAFLDPKDSDLWDTKTAPATETIVEEDALVDENKEDGSSKKDEEKADDDDTAVPLPSNDSVKDVQMGGGELPPTPPASPGQKPQDLQPLGPPPLPPRRFSTTTNSALARAQMNATQQQDVTEVHDGIQFRLRAGLRPEGRDASGEQTDELLRLFSINLIETPIKDGKSLKSKELTDSAIQLNVPNEPTDIYAALDAIFDQQTVEDSQHLERYKSIAQLPPFLQINIPRVGFNKEKGEQFKSEHSIKLEDELYLDRYFVGSSDNDISDQRRSAWGWRRKLSALKSEYRALSESACGVDGPTAIAEAAKYIKSLENANDNLEALNAERIEIDADISNLLQQTANQQAIRMREVQAEILQLESHLDSQFNDLKRIKYRLQAVFFHRGKTAHGHYWICIRDFSSNMWRRYNDERVEDVPQDKWHEIYEANEWAHGTPTYAVYVRDELREEYVQPVCRNPEKAATSDQPTVDEMQEDGASTAQNHRDSPSRGDSTDSNNPVKPNVLVQEGGSLEWDETRQVSDAKW